MAITLDGSNGISTPDLESAGAISGTTGAFSGNVTANGLSTELRPLVLDTAKASTSGTTVDFTGIPSWVKRVTVMLSGVSLSGSSYPVLRIGDSGGIETSGYAANSVANYGAGGSAIIVSTTGFPVYDNTRSSTASVWTGAFTLTNFSGNEWVCTGTFLDSDNTGAVTSTAGNKTLSAALDRVQMLSFNGTDAFDAGTINIMYE